MAHAMSLPQMVEALERKYGSLNSASRKADIPTSTLLKIKRGSDPRLSTLKKVAHGLEMTLPDMLTEYGERDGGSN